MDYKENFIKKAILKHGNKYNYSKVEYVNNHTPVCIICPEHGEFWQTPQSHLHNRGCKKCSFKKISNKKTNTTEWFIEKSRKIHGDKYDYSKVEYKGNRYNVKIICPEHGEFIIQAANHLKGKGCQKCSYNKLSNIKTKTNENFIKEAKKIHGDKYDYSKVEYFGSTKKIKIICPEHGEFEQLASSHIEGSGCPICANNQKITTEEFIKRAKKIHGDKYDYSKTNYKWNREKVIITCHNKDSNDLEHGDFITTPHSHLNGSGCPKCKQNYKLENEVRKLLVDNGFNFEEKPKLKGLKYKYHLRPDFYLPNENIIIECQGKQHFEPVNFGGVDEKELKKQYELGILRDSIKKKYCEENGIKLLEYTNLKIDDENLIKTKNKLLKEIQKYDSGRNS